MTTLQISSVLARIIERYVRDENMQDRNSRLLVPGLTDQIAIGIHETLLESGVNSFLVIGEDEEPSEEGQLISAVGLTSKRIGSFVAVVTPGELAHIQDSVRGSGGTIRSVAFSEEWPWIDGGAESFRFDGPVLDALVESWTGDPEEQAWLRKIVLSVLVDHTRSSSRRTNILLEEILGSFRADLYPEIDGTRQKFLCHCGIPLPPGDLGDIARIKRETDRLCKRIIDRCQKESDIRDQAKDMASDLLPPATKEDSLLSLEYLIDGIGQSAGLDLGVLAFFGCWGPKRSDTSHWQNLPAQLLASIFGVRERETSEVLYGITCDRGLISDDGSTLITFADEKFDLDVSYRIPAEQFAEAQWVVRILNRQRIVAQQELNGAEGRFVLPVNVGDCASSHDRKVPLRVALLADDKVESFARLTLHACAEERPAIAVVDRVFEVIDATPDDDEGESKDSKIVVNTPVHIFLLSHDDAGVVLTDEDEEEVEIYETNDSKIWRTVQRIDVSADLTGVVTRIASFGASSATICLETTDVEHGEFTVEDELREKIVNGSKPKLRELLAVFNGAVDEPYMGLGRIDDAARKRIALAKLVTAPTGWRPLLVDLLNTSFSPAGLIGDYVAFAGQIDRGSFAPVELPVETRSILESYSQARSAVIKRIESQYGDVSTAMEHPLYATHPVFSRANRDQLESLITAYLDSYSALLRYVKQSGDRLEWGQLFALCSTDCVVHWDSTKLRNSFMLIGPWHPLVVASRFMVQGELYARLRRLLKDAGGQRFRNLVALLNGTQGFRWTVGLSADDREVEPMYVSPTSDPGWCLAIRTGLADLAAREYTGSLSNLTRLVRRNLGLAIGAVGENDFRLVATCISNFQSAYPSRRSIGARIRHGYSSGNVVGAVDRLIHLNDSPSAKGKQLPGGVRLFIEDKEEVDTDARWMDPPLHVYRYDDDEDCVREQHPDIFFLPPTTERSFKDVPMAFQVPRGQGRSSVFSQEVSWLTEGQSQVPKSFTYEYDPPIDGINQSGLEGSFTNALQATTRLLDEPIAAVCDVGLPQRLSAPWVVLPGQSIDPAVLVKYVRDGAERDIQDRVLWDYKLDVTGTSSSYFVLSSIPKGFQVAVSGFFESDQLTTEFIVELGEMGVAIGGEALRSGRHALGVVGLVGAFRLFTGKAGDGQAPLSTSWNQVGFLIPVDSFTSFFGGVNNTVEKRTDLLAVQLSFFDEAPSRLVISACGVESKFVSKTFSVTSAHAALEQARQTEGDFKQLAVAGQLEGAMSERLALLRIVQFGMRVISPSAPSKIGQWTEMERKVYDAILKGEYKYKDANRGAVLVSTEGQLTGVAESVVLEEGLWCRLTRTHFPGIYETEHIEKLRNALSNLFDKPAVSSGLISIEQTASEEEGTPSTDDAELPTEREESAAQDDESGSPSTGEAGDKKEEDPGPEAEVSNTPLEKIFIGVDDARSAIYYDPKSPIDPLDNLNVMVTGSSGKGKTQFLKYLIQRLRSQGKNVLVLDLKNDFAGDEAFCEQAQLDRVFVAFDGLPLNPLIPYPIRHPGTGQLHIQCGQHVAGVTSVLKRTYGLGAQQQIAVKNAIVGAFENLGISTTGSTEYADDIQFPDFSVVGDALEHDNPAAYNRLDPLFTLGLFREQYRNSSFHELVSRSSVLDLSQIPSDEIKNALAQLVVLTSHAYYNSQPHSGSIRQYLVFDEGHRVLGSDYMLRLVRECRAYGVGTILSSQYPSDFPGDISASMATKIVHGNDSDAEKVKQIVQLLGCEGREGDVANLGRFHAFVDNRHHRRALARTMNYPLHLIWARLQELGDASRDDLAQAEGFDPAKLPIGNLVRQLEQMGLAEEREGRVYVL